MPVGLFMELLPIGRIITHLLPRSVSSPFMLAHTFHHVAGGVQKMAPRWLLWVAGPPGANWWLSPPGPFPVNRFWASSSGFPASFHVSPCWIMVCLISSHNRGGWSGRSSSIRHNPMGGDTTQRPLPQCQGPPEWRRLLLHTQSNHHRSSKDTIWSARKRKPRWPPPGRDLFWHFFNFFFCFQQNNFFLFVRIKNSSRQGE